MDTVHLNFDSLIAKCKGDTDTVIRRFVIGLSARIIMRSPVDTGRFRANWTVGFGAPGFGDVNASDTGPVTSDGSGNSKTKRQVTETLMNKGNNWVGNQVVFMTNGLPYAYGLEYGWHGTPASRQAPQGMVRLSVNDYAQILQQAVPFNL